jgi:hypothetical protein
MLQYNMIDVLTFVPGKKKLTSSGWVSFNAPCCVHRGNSQDRRQRGGIKPAGDEWSYHCFNCGYTASFVLGRPVSFKARKLLEWLGVDRNDIEMLNLESLKHKSIHGLIEGNRQVIKAVEFEERDLPADLELLDINNPAHDSYLTYLIGRSIDPTAYPYMVSPEGTGRAKDRIVIPFTHGGQVVGNTARFLDNRQPKFISDTQPGYVFGFDLQKENWTQAIVVEGVFDALSINGLGVLHNDINPQQAQLIRSLGRDITVVPDQDAAGMTLIDRAVELGWGVSMPDWPEGIKDVNDAVIRYGRLGTLMIILANRETSKIKIELKRKKLVKQFK